jgi:hypothetical protein
MTDDAAQLDHSGPRGDSLLVNERSENTDIE